MASHRSTNIPPPHMACRTTARPVHMLKNISGAEVATILKERGRDLGGIFQAEGSSCVLGPGDIEQLSGFTKGIALEEAVRQSKEQVEVRRKSSKVVGHATSSQAPVGCSGGASLSAAGRGAPEDRVARRLHLTEGCQRVGAHRQGLATCEALAVASALG